MTDNPIEPRERMKVTAGLTFKEKLSNNCGTVYISINSDAQGICEIFVVKGKSGGCVSAYAEAVGRLASLALASGISPEHIIKQLKGIRCPYPTVSKEETIYSCPDALAKTLERFLNRDKPKENQPIDTNNSTENKESAIRLGEKPECPDCSTILVSESGCLVCKGCGWSKCF